MWLLASSYYKQAIVFLIEKWKPLLDRSWYAGAVLMDVSEAFDTIKHDLLTLLTPRIPESYIKIKINLNFHFHIS